MVNTIVSCNYLDVFCLFVNNEEIIDIFALYNCVCYTSCDFRAWWFHRKNNVEHLTILNSRCLGISNVNLLH